MLKTPRMMEEEEKNKNFGEHYLTDNVRYCHLLIFLEKHQSRVYLLFYLAVEHYKMIMDFSLLKLKAKEIYDEYFAENSKFKLKLNHQIKKNIKQVLGKYSEITVSLFNQAQKETLSIIEKLFPEFIKSDIYQEMESLVKHKILVQRVVDTAEEKNTDISHLTFNQLKQMGHQVKEKYLEMEGDEKNVYIPKKTIEKRKSRPVSFGVVVSLIKNESNKRGNKNEIEKSHTMRGFPTNSALISPQSEDNQKWNAYINKYATLSMRKSSTTLLKGLKKLSKEFGVDPLPILNNGESEKIIENGHDKLRESTEEEKDKPKRNSEENHGITEKPSRKAPLPKEPTFSKLDWIDSSSEDEIEGIQLKDDNSSKNESNGETSLDSPVTKHIIRKSVTGEKKIMSLGTNQEISNNNIHNNENNDESDQNRKKSRFDNFDELVNPSENKNNNNNNKNNDNIIKIEEKTNNNNIPPKEKEESNNVVKKEEPKLVKAKTKFKFSITPNEELEAPRTNRFDNITMGNKKIVKKDLLAHEDVGDFSEIEIHSMLVRISKKLEKEPYFESFLPIKQKTFYQLAQTGVILCVLLDKLIPNSIFHSHRAIVWHPNREEEKYHNISLCLNTALNCGLDVEEITVESILEGDIEVQIGFLWQLIKGGIDHQLFCDTTLRPQLAKEFNIAIEEVFDWDTETLLFGWVNCHLKNSGYPDPLSSMADLRDGYIYLCLLQELTGENVEEAVSEPKTKKRVEKVISILTKKRVPEIVTVNSIMTGKERMNYHLLGFLYCVKKYLNGDSNSTNEHQQQNIN